MSKPTRPTKHKSAKHKHTKPTIATAPRPPRHVPIVTSCIHPDHSLNSAPTLLHVIDPYNLANCGYVDTADLNPVEINQNTKICWACTENNSAIRERLDYNNETLHDELTPLDFLFINSNN